MKPYLSIIVAALCTGCPGEEEPAEAPEAPVEASSVEEEGNSDKEESAEEPSKEGKAKAAIAE